VCYGGMRRVEERKAQGNGIHVTLGPSLERQTFLCRLSLSHTDFSSPYSHCRLVSTTHTHTLSPSFSFSSHLLSPLSLSLSLSVIDASNRPTRSLSLLQLSSEFSHSRF
jgi:hypothetical protein